MMVELFMQIAAFVGMLVAGFWVVFSVAGRQYEKRLDERFAGQDKARTEGRESYERRIGAAERELRELHTAFLKHLADLPRDYMRREDHIRFETVINAKLDALGSKFELLTDRLPVRT